ncbi:MAG: hypothetical protein WCF95_01130 [bacterium]
MKKQFYVKDPEGFVIKITDDKLTDDLIIITKEEYAELSGLNYYKKTYGRGGKRDGAGRPRSKTPTQAYSLRIKEELDLKIKTYAKNHNIKNKTTAIKKLIENGLNIA